MKRIKKKCCVCEKSFNKSIIYKGLMMCHNCYLHESGVMPFPIESLDKVLERIMNKDYKIKKNGCINLYLSNKLAGLKVRVIPVDMLLS